MKRASNYCEDLGTDQKFFLGFFCASLFFFFPLSPLVLTMSQMNSIHLTKFFRSRLAATKIRGKLGVKAKGYVIRQYSNSIN